MRSRQLLLTVFAGVFSLIVVVGALWNPRASRPSRMAVAVAVTRDLEAGTELTSDMLAIVTFPEDHLPEGIFTTSDELIGQTLRGPAQRNQLIYPIHLMEKDSRQSLQSKIPEGHRGYTIQLNSASAGLAGFALPGSRVDVLSHLDSPRGQEQPASEIVVENVLILAVDEAQNPEKVSSSPKTMTLLVSNLESPLIDAAQARGPLRLALRNGSDQTLQKVTPVTPAPARAEEAPDEIPVEDASKPRKPSAEFSVLVMRGPTTGATTVRNPRLRPSPLTVQSNSRGQKPTR